MILHCVIACSRTASLHVEALPAIEKLSDQGLIQSIQRTEEDQEKNREAEGILADKMTKLLKEHMNRLDSKQKAEAESKQCGVCWRDDGKQYLFVPCGHVFVCEDCRNDVYHANGVNQCPLCHTIITATHRVFL